MVINADPELMKILAGIKLQHSFYTEKGWNADYI